MYVSRKGNSGYYLDVITLFTFPRLLSVATIEKINFIKMENLNSKLGITLGLL